jgi:hypothetical protein
VRQALFATAGAAQALTKVSIFNHRGATLGDARSISTDTDLWSWFLVEKFTNCTSVSDGCLFDTQKIGVVPSKASFGSFGLVQQFQIVEEPTDTAHKT